MEDKTENNKCYVCQIKAQIVYTDRFGGSHYFCAYHYNQYKKAIKYGTPCEIKKNTPKTGWIQLDLQF